MADYDRRPRRGGGQFNNRKRRYRDDDYDDRRPQRRRYEEPLAVTVRKQLLAIADSPLRKPEDDVDAISKSLADNYFDSDLTSGFLDLVVNLTIEQPPKVPFIAAIVLILNARKPEFAADALKRITSALQQAIDEGNWRDVKLLLRLLGCLQGLFENDGIFPFLEDLFSCAAELQMKASEDLLGLELVKIILLTMAYTMSSSASGFEGNAVALLEKTDIVASTPHTLENLVDPFPPHEAGITTSSESSLSLLQKHLQEEAGKEWRLACLPRPWRIPSLEQESDLLTSAQKHPFPSLTIPENVPLGPQPLFPEVYFSVYSEQEIETVPAATNTQALLIRDVLTDTIEALDCNRSVAAKFLIELDCYFAPNTFAKRATQFDKLRDLETGQPTWKPEDVIVDAAFALLFKLPAPEHKTVYYHAVLTEACKLAPAAVAPSLGRAIRFLYRNVGRLDLELATRFLDWFSHHLSNFGFTWKWTEWVDDLELSDSNPRKAFIVDAIDKEIRLSFAQRIKGTLPEQYQSLISPEKEKDAPDFKFNNESTPFAEQGREFAQLIRKKAGNDEFDPVFEQIGQTAVSSGVSNPSLAAIDAFVTAICWVGCKSISHVLACVERCRERFMQISTAGLAEQKQIVTSVMDYWSSQTGVGVCIVTKLLNYQILTPMRVVEWALIDKIDRGTILRRVWCSELVTQTADKVASKIHAIVHAIRQHGLSDDQKSTLQTTLDTERETFKNLCTLIEDSLSSISQGNHDEMMESSEALRMEEENFIKIYGLNWMRVFRRKFAVEENWVNEELAKPLPPPPAAEPAAALAQSTAAPEVKMGDGESNGVEAVNGNNGISINGGGPDGSGQNDSIE